MYVCLCILVPFQFLGLKLLESEVQKLMKLCHEGSDTENLHYELVKCFSYHKFIQHHCRKLIEAASTDTPTDQFNT